MTLLPIELLAERGIGFAGKGMYSAPLPPAPTGLGGSPDADKRKSGGGAGGGGNFGGGGVPPGPLSRPVVICEGDAEIRSSFIFGGGASSGGSTSISGARFGSGSSKDVEGGENIARGSCRGDLDLGLSLDAPAPGIQMSLLSLRFHELLSLSLSLSSG